MAEFRLTPLAAADLVNIRTVIAQDKPATANRYLSILREKCRLLAENPDIGVAGGEYLGLSRFAVGDYLIFYRPASYGVDIVRVLHGSRDIKNILQK